MYKLNCFATLFKRNSCQNQCSIYTCIFVDCLQVEQLESSSLWPMQWLWPSM